MRADAIRAFLNATPAADLAKLATEPCRHDGYTGAHCRVIQLYTDASDWCETCSARYAARGVVPVAYKSIRRG